MCLKYAWPHTVPAVILRERDFKTVCTQQKVRIYSPVDDLGNIYPYDKTLSQVFVDSWV